MTLTIISVGTLFILLAFGWIMPALTQPTLPFGVRVPPERASDPAVARVRRGYRAALVIGFVVVAGAVVALARASRTVWLAQGVALIGIVVFSAAYYVAHRRLHETKLREGWYVGQREALVANIAPPDRRIPFPFLWLLPALAVLATTIVIGALRYPKLPATIPTHFDLNGTPNGFSAKMPSAFLLTGTEVALTLLFGALAWFIPRLRYDLDPADPHVSAERQRLFRLRWSRALLLFAALTNLSMLFGSLLIWQVMPANHPLTLAATLAPAGLILLGAFGLAILTGQGGARMRVSGTSGKTGYVHRDDDRFWKGGMIYYNPDDPALLVEKRFGVGWTLNFARPTAWVFIGAVVVVIVASALLPALLK